MISGLIEMALHQGKSNRKPSGGRLVASRGKRKFEISREKQYTRIGDESLKQYRGMGGNSKVGILVAEYANVLDRSTNTVQRTKIINVRRNPRIPTMCSATSSTRARSSQQSWGTPKSRPGPDSPVRSTPF